MKPETVAMLKSWGRVFVTAALATYIAMGVAPWEINEEGWKAVLASGVAATVLTVYNWFRSSNTAFGIGSPNDPTVKLSNADPNDISEDISDASGDK